jgi:hypothetical protein
MAQFLISFDELLPKGFTFLFRQKKLNALPNYVTSVPTSLTCHHVQRVHQLVR